MGICVSKTQSPEERRADAEINKMLQQARKEQQSEVKLLLLGAGESGKSTIAKQMKIIHLQGFSDEERLQYKSVVHNNVIHSMRALVGGSKKLDIALGSDVQEAADRFMNMESSLDFTWELTEQMVADIKVLWKDKGIKAVYDRSSELQINDSAAYYLDSIGRISAEGYIPSEQDVLRTRAKTTGIIETEFVIERTKFRLVDVGGQRSERKKWMHCFQDVTAVIFCVALSEYDLNLYEDDTTNRLLESLTLFKEVCNNHWFKDTAMILFLNKKDLFQEKIQKTNITNVFPEYTGGKNYENALAYIKKQFLAVNENPKKQVFTHATCATDTESVTVVFNAVKDVILHQMLKESGLE